MTPMRNSEIVEVFHEPSVGARTALSARCQLKRLADMAVRALSTRLLACLLLCVLCSFSATAEPPAAYSIPLIDLASETNRQVIVDREPGQYLGHPTTVLLEDGRTILCVYPRGHGKGAIAFKRSLDGGRTWSERLPVPENWATSLETPTIHRVAGAAGKKRLIVWSGLFPARHAVSEDDGSTWTPLKPAGDWGGIVVMGSVEAVRGQSGRYLAWFHDDGRFIRVDSKQEKPIVFRLYQVESGDGGLTWSQPRELFASSDVHLCEPGVIRSPDGRQLAMLLRENSRRRNSHVMFSDDEGRNWTTPRELPGALTGDRHTGKYAPDGRLFISFRDTTRQSKTQGDWVGWVGTYEDIVAGREGQYRVRLMDNHHRWDCAYPGVEVLPDGTFVTTTYGHWVEGEKPYVVSVRFSLKELDARVRPPGVVIAHSPAPTGIFLGSPSLAMLPDGQVIAAHDHFGPRTTHDLTHIYGSTDGGITWKRRAAIKGAFWSSIFPHRDALYLLGPDHQDGHVVIRRSADAGRTWTEPRAANSGLLLADAKYHCAPMPVIEHNGRLWRAMEDVMGPGGWGSNFRSFMMSIPSDADLLVAGNWTVSSRLGRDASWLEGKFGGWLEGNAVVSPSGEMLNILRADYRDPDEKATVIKISPDGKAAVFDASTGFIPFPGGCKKFAVRRDLRDGGYWSLANWIPPEQRGGNVERTRNTLALLYSPDALHWEIRCVLLHHPDRINHGFQYADFQFDGNDLLGLVRTAFDDATGGAHGSHDANYITFHRWKNFRSLTAADGIIKSSIK